MPGAWETIDLGGIQGLLVRGNFEPPFDSEEEYMAFADSEERFTYAYWNVALGLRLLWVDNGVYYELVSPNMAISPADFKLQGQDTLDYMLPSISEDELIRIAESIVSQSD